jgi:hypothetical protein
MHDSLYERFWSILFSQLELGGYKLKVVSFPEEICLPLPCLSHWLYFFCFEMTLKLILSVMDNRVLASGDLDFDITLLIDCIMAAFELFFKTETTDEISDADK